MTTLLLLRMGKITHSAQKNPLALENCLLKVIGVMTFSNVCR